ncbi:MAG: DUF3696 domain-containing protein [Ktedonobacteraceae bacterium]
MLKSWSIQNFKPILDSGELQLKPVTILAGRNSSGKSSLIQSILMIAQTLSNPLPERALLPNGPLVQLGTWNDVLCNLSDSRAITFGFEFIYQGKVYVEGIEGIREEQTHKLQTVIDIIGERSLGSWTLEASKAVLESLFLRSDYVEYTIPSEVIISNGIREQFTDVDSEDDIIELNYTSLPSEYWHDLKIKKLPDDEVSTFLESIKSESRSIAEQMLRSKQPIYLGQDNSPFNMGSGSELGDLETEDLPWNKDTRKPDGPDAAFEVNTNYRSEVDASSKDVDVPHEFLVTISHFLPSRLLRIAYKTLEDRDLDFPFEPNSAQIMRFFTSQIRYLSPLRPDPDETRRTFAPSSELDEVGPKGEYAAVVYHYNQLAHINWYNPKTMQVEEGTLKDAMNAWVRYLEVANEVTTEEGGSLGIGWKVVIKKRQETRTLPQVGGGMNHLLPILVMGLLSPKNTLLIIEEPEVTLHPNVQARLGDFFMGLAKCGKQCLIETHSENLVSQLRYHIVQAGGMDKSDCMIYFVDQDERGAAKFEKVEISAKGNILNWPDGFFDETMLQEGRITTASLRKRAKKTSDD